jgi:hypothetical protein
MAVEDQDAGSIGSKGGQNVRGVDEREANAVAEAD